MCDCLILRVLGWCVGMSAHFKASHGASCDRGTQPKGEKTGKSSIRREPIRLERERRSGRSIHRHIRRKDRRQRRQTLLSDRRPIKPAVPPRMLLGRLVLPSSPHPSAIGPYDRAAPHTHPPRAAYTMPQYQQRLRDRLLRISALHAHCGGGGGGGDTTPPG